MAGYRAQGRPAYQDWDQYFELDALRAVAARAEAAGAAVAARPIPVTVPTGILGGVTSMPTARHLVRAKDLADGRYFERLTVADLARAAGLSPAHFSRAFRREFGESPHAYLLTRRLERSAALLRMTDSSVADICISVGLESVGSFTTSFTRMFGMPPTAYRANFPPARAHALIPACVLRAYGRPQHRTFREDQPVAG
jgi:AraC-like DNA-binding protein